MTFMQLQEDIKKRLIEKNKEANPNYDYDVEETEKKDYDVIKIIALREGKEYLNIQNIMTIKGSQELTLQNSWNEWIKEHIHLLQEKISQKEKQPRKKEIIIKILKWLLRIK